MGKKQKNRDIAAAVVASFENDRVASAIPNYNSTIEEFAKIHYANYGRGVIKAKPNKLLYLPLAKLQSAVEAGEDCLELLEAVKTYDPAFFYIVSSESGDSQILPFELKFCSDNRQVFDEFSAMHLSNASIYATAFIEGFDLAKINALLVNNIVQAVFHAGLKTEIIDRLDRLESIDRINKEGNKL